MGSAVISAELCGFFGSQHSPLCQSASRVKLIHGLSSTGKAEDLWTARLGTAYCHGTPFSWIAVALCAMQNSSPSDYDSYGVWAFAGDSRGMKPELLAMGRSNSAFRTAPSKKERAPRNR